MRVARTTDNRAESRWTSRAFRDDARACVARAYRYTAVTALRADLARITRVRRLLCRSETPVLKFVVSGPVRSDVSSSVASMQANERASEWAAMLTLCTRAYLHYVRVVTRLGLKNIYIFARCMTQRLCKLSVYERAELLIILTISIINHARVIDWNFSTEQQCQFSFKLDEKNYN